MIAGAVGGAPAIINSQTGSQISFRIAENRSASVLADLFVRETGQKIITEAAAVSLAGAQSASGSNASATIPGPLTWDGPSVPLFATKIEDKTILPFEANIAVNWKGVVAGGAALADGNYTLCLNVTDEDVNPRPRTAPGRCDTSVRLPTKPLPALDGRAA